MAEWLVANWFQVLAVLGVSISWLVHFRISTEKWKATEARVEALEVKLTKCVEDIEEKIDELQASFSVHTTNSDIHVSPTLLQLFNERHDYNKKQFDETRNDIQRIENLLTQNR